MRATFLLLLMAVISVSCTEVDVKGSKAMDDKPTPTEVSDAPEAPVSPEVRIELATFGAGCFWCVEAVFLELDGVIVVESGYAGGHIKDPTYKQVCLGNTGHAEVCQIKFDPAKVTFDELLEVFWKTHDPTTLNRQGNDTGTQYRSAVFYHDENQKQLAEKYKKELDAAGAFDDPIVTEIVPYESDNYYKAEDYHQNYFAQNPTQPYCAFVVGPKVDKVRKVFKDKLKK